MSAATAEGTVSGRCLELRQIYRATDARQFPEEAGLSEDAAIAQSDGRIMSAFVRARKPAATAKTCCGPTCCSCADSYASGSERKRYGPRRPHGLMILPEVFRATTFIDRLALA